MTLEHVQNEVANGGRFVLYTYTISIGVMTFKRPSSIYFIKAGEKGFFKGLPFTLTSLFLGWWGIPWGPVYTFGSLYHNLKGGKVVTNEVMASFSKNLSQ